MNRLVAAHLCAKLFKSDLVLELLAAIATGIGGGTRLLSDVFLTA